MKKIAIIAMIFCLSKGATAATSPQPPDEYIPNTLTLEAPANHGQKWTKPLPCPTGFFSTVITVFNPAERAQFQSGGHISFFGKDSDPGITFYLNTTKHLLPLEIHIDTIGRTADDVISSERSRETFAPGEAVTLEVTWVDSRSFSFLINGHEKYTISLREPVSTLHLVGVGSRAVFDKNTIQCNLTS